MIYDNCFFRGYGDASIPPTIMVEGKDVMGDTESCSRASSKSRIYTPGPPLTPTQVRRMSTLSTLSVTVQDKDFTVRPVSPAAGSNDPLFEQGEVTSSHHISGIRIYLAFERGSPCFFLCEFTT